MKRIIGVVVGVVVLGITLGPGAQGQTSPTNPSSNQGTSEAGKGTNPAEYQNPSAETSGSNQARPTPFPPINAEPGMTPMPRDTPTPRPSPPTATTTAPTPPI